MADILNDHWSSVFSRQEVHLHKLRSWLGGISKLLDPSDPRWGVKLQHIVKAMDNTRDTSLGPDGMPFSAFKAVKDIASQALFDLALFLGNRDSTKYLSPDYKHAFLCCLPKKPSGRDSSDNDYFDAECTRPLSVVNTDNRIVASAYKQMLEPIANSWVSSMQQGFLEN